MSFAKSSGRVLLEDVEDQIDVLARSNSNSGQKKDNLLSFNLTLLEF